MRRYYGLLFMAAVVLVMSFPTVALAARKGVGSIVWMLAVAGIAFAWYLIKLAVRRARDLKSDVRYHDAMRSGQTIPLQDDEKDAVNSMVNSFLEAAHKAAAKPEVDLPRLELAVYDNLMKALNEAGIVLSPELRKGLKRSVQVAIAKGAAEGELASS